MNEKKRIIIGITSIIVTALLIPTIIFIGFRLTNPKPPFDVEIMVYIDGERITHRQIVELEYDGQPKKLETKVWVPSLRRYLTDAELRYQINDPNHGIIDIYRLSIIITNGDRRASSVLNVFDNWPTEKGRYAIEINFASGAGGLAVAPALVWHSSRVRFTIRII